MVCIKFFPYKLKHKPAFFSTVYCFACSRRLWKLFTNNNNIHLREEALFIVWRVGCKAITGEIFVSVQQLTVITVPLWSCQRIMQPHCGSQKLWTDFHLNGSNMHLKNGNREFNTGNRFSYTISILCDIVCCSSAQNIISLNRDS